jgi:hypothetical protein
MRAFHREATRWQRLDGKPVRDQGFRAASNGPCVLQLEALPRFCVVRSRTFRDICLFEKWKQLGQALGPSFFEIDVLGMRDLQGRGVCGKPQGNDEAVFLDALGGFNRDGDFVSDALLLHAARCRNE